MKTKEIREKYKIRLKIPRGEMLSNEEFDSIKIYNDRIRFLIDKKRKGDVKLISDILGFSQPYIEKCIVNASYKHHESVIDILDDIVTNREALKKKYTL